MIRMLVIAVGIVLLDLCSSFSACAVENRVLKARVLDVENRPIEGAKLFLYNSSNVRRPADFISSLSDKAGIVQIFLPPGKFWGVARFKADGKYGPLLPGDKHSGEPLEIDLSSDGGVADFVVADIREIGQKKHSRATEAFRLKGAVLDLLGKPVSRVFVYSNASKEFSEVPEYVSAWTTEDGRYELYVPVNDKFFVGVSRDFPLKLSGFGYKPIEVAPGKIDIAIDMNLTVE